MKTITKAEAKRNKAEAIKRGEKTYDDTPCSKCGHTKRYTNSGKCVNCHAERNKRRKRGKAGKTATTSKAVSKAVAAVVPVNSEPLTGEVISGDWRFYSDRITATWQNAAENIIATGKLLIEAKDAVDHGDWLKLVEELPFSEDTAQRLMAIARHPVISNAERVRYLPPSWGTLYQLTRLIICQSGCA